MIKDLEKRISKIEYTLHGNGAFGLIKQVRILFKLSIIKIVLLLLIFGEYLLTIFQKLK